MKRTFIITGCERSGTTLLKLILDAHSKISVVDEDEVGHNGERFDVMLGGSETLVTGFKLPMVSSDIGFLKSKKNIKIIFIVRDPRDVISSMQKLMIPYNAHETLKLKYFLSLISQTLFTSRPFSAFKFILIKLKLLRRVKLPWSLHPDCIDSELIDSIPTEKKAEISIHKILKQHPLARTNQMVLPYLGHIWAEKNNMPLEYGRLGFDYHVIKYEDMLSQTEKAITGILNFLDLEFEPEMLDFYKKKTGMSIGNTRNDQPIMKNNFNKWKSSLSDKDIKIIGNICGKTANGYNYSIS